MAGIQLNSVKKVYPNGFHALHGVDLDIEDGEFMVFVGRPAAPNPPCCG